MKAIGLDALIKAGRSLSPPFALALTDGTCQVRDIHRLLPGKRLTARGSYRGRDVLLKLFFGRGARRRFAKDKRGAAILARSGVNTPEMLWESATTCGRGCALVFEFVARAHPIKSGECRQSAEHAGLAVEALACLHSQGVEHGDPHLGNFIVRDGCVLVVDGGAVRQRRSALGEAAAIRGLAAFLAGYPLAEDFRVPMLLSHYAAKRGWPDRARRRGQLQAALFDARRRRVREYLGKTERECTDFRCERGWRHVWLAKRRYWSEALAEFANNTDAGLAGAEVLKNGRSATVFRLRLGKERVVVKRYNIKSTAHRLRRYFKPRSRHAWRNGHRLVFLSIPTAEPIALIERRWGPLRAESWLVMRDCGDLDVCADVQARGWTQPTLAGVLRIFRDLKTAGICHGDTKASNLIARNGNVYIVDLDGMRQGSGTASDVARFLENFEGQARSQAEEAFSGAGLLRAYTR